MGKLTGKDMGLAVRAKRTRRLERLASTKELLERMMPKQEERMQKLQELVRLWASVVGPGRARQSAPCDLVGGKLVVAVATPHMAQQIAQMKGNIQRALRERWGLEVEEVQTPLGPPPVRPSAPNQPPRRRAPVVRVEEAEVQALKEQCPADLTPEAAEALARLRAFFARRFGGRAGSEP